MNYEGLKRILCVLLISLLTGLQILTVWANEGDMKTYGYGYGYFLPPVQPSPEELLINEFQSRPSSGESEWIELYNSTEKNLSLETCELRDAVGLIVSFSSDQVLAPGGHLLHELSSNKLNNSGDTLQLLCGDVLIDEVAYGNHSSESFYRSVRGYDETLGYLPSPGVDKSLARFPDGSETWFIFGEPTPGQANEVENENPQAVITLQGTKKTSGCGSLSVNITGEDSTDPDDDALSYAWEYREKISGKVLHSTDRSNPLSFKFESNMGEQFEISLKLSDPFGGTHESIIPISLNECTAARGAPSAKLPASSFQLSSNIHINELFPNPAGADKDNEFIELYNAGSVPVRLDGWKLGAKTKKKLDGRVIDAKSFLIFKNITLRNSGDIIQLLDPDTQIQSEVSYEKAKENKSWSKHPSGSFSWTIATPSQKNDFPFQTETIYLQASSPLIITKFLPNPKGKDSDNEWIEIMNRSDQALTISGWQLDNREGSSKAYSLSGTLRSQQVLRVQSSESKITLRNSADQVRLLDSSGQVLDLLEWSSPAPDGKIFQRNQLIRDLSIEPDVVEVVKVVDGDTIDIQIDGDIERVRLIGVDTPETVHPFKALEHFGKEASNYTRSRLEGKQVRLEYDLSKRGKYGRLLAYVWLDDKHFNAELIEKGYAFAYLNYPFKYREDFRRLELQAEQSGLGLWASEDIQSIRMEQDLVVDEELKEFELIEEILEELEEKEEEIPEEELVPDPQSFDQSGWDEIFLNEILANPTGKDSDGGEFIELINLSGADLDLSGWQIQNAKGKKIWEQQLTAVARTAHQLSSPRYILIHPSSSIKNSKENLHLVDPLGSIRDSFSYEQSMKDDQVWIRNAITSSWSLSDQSSPARANPIVLISADDPDGDGLASGFELKQGYDPHQFDSDQDGLPDDFELLFEKGFEQEYQAYLSKQFSVKVRHSTRILSFSGASRPYSSIHLHSPSSGQNIIIPVQPDGTWSYKVDFGLESGQQSFSLTAHDPNGVQSKSELFELMLSQRLNASKLPKKKRSKKAKAPQPLYDIIERPQPLSMGFRFFPFARAAVSTGFNKDREPIYLGGFLVLLLLALLLFKKHFMRTS